MRYVSKHIRRGNEERLRQQLQNRIKDGETSNYEKKQAEEILKTMQETRDTSRITEDSFW